VLKAHGQTRLRLFVSVRKRRDVRCKFSQLVSNHVLCYGKVDIILPVVYLKFEADKVWEDGCRPCLCPDWQNAFAGLLRQDGKAFVAVRASWRSAWASRLTAQYWGLRRCVSRFVPCRTAQRMKIPGMPYLSRPTDYTVLGWRTLRQGDVKNGDGQRFRACT